MNNTKNTGNIDTSIINFTNNGSITHISNHSKEGIKLLAIQNLQGSLYITHYSSFNFLFHSSIIVTISSTPINIPY